LSKGAQEKEEDVEGKEHSLVNGLKTNTNSITVLPQRHQPSTKPRTPATVSGIKVTTYHHPLLAARTRRTEIADVCTAYSYSLAAVAVETGGGGSLILP